MVDDAGLRISSSHLTPSVREYTKENMPKFDEFWKKATDIHAELGVSCMVQPSLPRIENEDDAKVVSEIFNRAGEITKKAGILWGYHNHSNEFKRVLKAGEKPEQNPNPWAPPKGTYIEELFLKIPIRIRLCSSWMYIGPLWGSKIPWNGWRIIRIVLSYCTSRIVGSSVIPV